MLHRKLAIFAVAAVVALGVYATSSQEAVAEKSKKKGQQIVLKIPGMTWPIGCKAKVNKALVKVPGVVKLTIDTKAKKAYLKVDSSKFALKAAFKALEDAGYKGNSVVKKKKKS